MKPIPFEILVCGIISLIRSLVLKLSSGRSGPSIPNLDGGIKVDKLSHSFPFFADRTLGRSVHVSP